MEEYKKVWIRKDMNKEEREEENELKKSAKEKNEARTEMEKRKFYWRVIDLRLRKWYRKRENTEVIDLK